MHEVETMMYAGEVPWFGSGHYVGDAPVSSKDAIIASGLDWEVEKRKIMTEEGVKIPSHKAVVRVTDDQILGIVGNRYKPFQNQDAFGFMDSLVDDGSMRYHTAGSLRNGQRVWLLGQVGSTDILPGDQVDQFLFLYNSHDGSSVLRCLFTNIRVVCANTARAALAAGKGSGVSLKHTGDLTSKVAESQRVLGLATTEFEQYAEFAKDLTQLQMNTKRWTDLTEILIPDNLEATFNTRTENARFELTELFEEGVGTDIQGVRGTGWGAHCAVVEYANYHKGSDNDAAQARRFESSLMGDSAKLIQKSTDVLAQYLRNAA